MSLVIDIIIIIAVIAAVYHGFSKGFVKSVMRFASLIISLICVFTLTSPLSEWLEENYISQKVCEITDDSLSSIVNAGTESLSIDQVLSDRPDALTAVADRFSFSIDDLIDYYNEFLSSLAQPDALKAMSEKIAAPTASAISTAVAAIIIFVVAMLVCILLTYLLDLLCRLPVLKQLNRFLGALFGIASALVIGWVIANLCVGLVNSLSSIKPDVFNSSVIENSIILKLLIENGLIFF